MAGGGARSDLRACAQQQLDVWDANDMLGSITRDRLLVYRLLAGQVRGREVVYVRGQGSGGVRNRLLVCGLLAGQVCTGAVVNVGVRL